MADGGPGILAEQQHRPGRRVTRPSETRQIGELIGLALNFAKGHSPDFAVGAFPDQRDFAGIRRVTITHVGGDVVARRDVPAERRIKFLVGLAISP